MTLAPCSDVKHRSSSVLTLGGVFFSCLTFYSCFKDAPSSWLGRKVVFQVLDTCIFPPYGRLNHALSSRLCDSDRQLEQKTSSCTVSHVSAFHMVLSTHDAGLDYDWPESFLYGSSFLAVLLLQFIPSAELRESMSNGFRYELSEMCIEIIEDIYIE